MSWLTKLFRGTDPDVTRLNTGAVFPADELLERRIRAARQVMGNVEPKSLREIRAACQDDLIGDRQPLDYDDLPAA